MASNSVKPERARRWGRGAGASALRGGAVAVVPLFAYLGYRLLEERAWWMVAWHVAVLGVLVAVVFRRRPDHRVQGSGLLMAVYWLAFVVVYCDGSAGDVQALLLSTVVLAVLLYGRAAGLVALLVNALLLAVTAWLWTGGGAMSALEGRRGGDIWLQPWLARTLVVTVLGGALTFVVGQLVAGLESALAEGTAHAQERRTCDDLLARAAEDLSRGNALLGKCSDTLHAAVGLGLDVAPTLAEDVLLDRAAALIGEKCGFFHVGIFLLDPAAEWAQLRAASSEGGQRMLSRRHRLRVGQEGIVGFVIARGEPRVASRVDADPVYYQNPDLPETKSEIAVPIRNQGRAIGVLDIQQTSPNAFSSEDIEAVQALADLVAAVLRNARLFRQLQESVAAERRVYAELSGQAWLERARAMEGIGYRYERGRVYRLAGPGPEGEAGAEGDGPALPTHAWPLSIRGRLAGRVEARKAAGQEQWTDTELEFMETVIEQLGSALESARLHEDAQSRAARDRLVADVTARTRETLDLDTVLRTAADQIYMALGLEEVVVHLVPPHQPDDPPDER